MLKYFINISLLLFTLTASFAQGTEKDTVKYKDRYGLRVGIDVFKPIYSFINEDRKGIEFVGDFRLTNRFYLAAELGFQESNEKEDFFNYYTNGQFIKVGVDFNAYKNWIGMENMFVVGLRYGFSRFKQTLNEYTVNADPFLPPQTIATPINYEGLTAHWVELVLGIKVEVLHNVFFGLIFKGNQMITSKQPDNFKNLYVPGFNKVYLNNNGFGFNYTVSYLIPLYRK